nr:kinetochore protein Nuf2 [Cryptomonas curvata]
MNNLVFEINLIDSRLKNLSLVVERFIEIFTGKKIEEINYPNLFFSKTFTYPELHENSSSFVILHRKIQYMILSVGIKDFSINDYLKANILKNKKISLALNSFVSFRAHQIFVLNEKGVNLKKINLQCYLTLNKLLVNKYKVKFIRNRINTNYVHVNNLRKKLYVKSNFYGIYWQLFFFYYQNIFLYRKILFYSKLLIEFKYKILYKINWFVIKKKNCFINKKNKKMVRRIFEIIKKNIVTMKYLIFFLKHKFFIFFLILKILKVNIIFYNAHEFVKQKSIFEFLIFQNLGKTKNKIFNFCFYYKSRIYRITDLNIDGNIKIKHILSVIVQKKWYVIFYFYKKKKFIKKKLRKISEIYIKRNIFFI